VGSRQRGVAPDRMRLGKGEAPGGAIVTERRGREPEEQSLLCVVQHPVEIAPVGDVSHERGWVHLAGHGPEHCPRTGEIALGEVGLHRGIDQVEVGGANASPRLAASSASG
jgi:hypothetical protein